jgi:hypothetical protein
MRSGMWVVLVATLVFLQSAALAAAKPVTLQVQAIQRTADAGEGGVNTDASALITVQVTNAKGTPVSNLGADSGNGMAIIALPAGWTLTTIVPPVGGTPMAPTQFINHGGGVYTIRVVPAADGVWFEGDYIFTAAFNNNSSTGQVLGKLTIQAGAITW